MPSFELEPLEGGERVKLSEEKITIGRGPFLQVTDKRVSRNHATLEVTDGQLILTPIHTNPCFFKSHGKGEKTNLKKDVAKILKHSDVFGLLPDKLFYRVLVKGLENGKNSREAKSETKTSTAGRLKMKARVSGGEMTLPLEKLRVLPRWMKGSSKRVSFDSPQKAPPTPAKRQTATNARTPKKKPARLDVEDSPPPRGRRGAPKRKAKEPSESEDELSEEERKPARRVGRAASQKVTKYTEDFALSDEEIEFSDDVESDHKRRSSRHKGSSEDEDFQMDEESSASDWEEEKIKKPSRAVKSTKKGGRGSRRRSSGGATRRSSRTSSKRRKRYAESESDEFDDYYDDDDNYVPRPSKRRAGPKKKESEEEELEEEEDEDDFPQGGGTKKAKREPRPSCMYGRKCYRKNPNHFTEFCHPGDASFDEEEAKEAKAEFRSDASSGEESEEKPEAKNRVKKSKPEDRSDASSGEESGNEVEPEAKKKPLREKDKKSVLHKASDDDGEPNTYDYDDSFIEDKRKRRNSDEEDSGELSESEEEDVKRLVKEARGFLRSKKAQKV